MPFISYKQMCIQNSLIDSQSLEANPYAPRYHLAILYCSLNSWTERPFLEDSIHNGIHPEK